MPDETTTATPPGMHAFAIIDRTGDTKFIWDPTNHHEVEAASNMFDDLVGKKKFLAFRVTGADGTKGEQVRRFDPTHEKLIFTPPMAGG